MIFGWGTKKKNKEHAFGITLSGGSLRGIGHIGTLKALEEHGIRPTILSGSSAGALIGAFYATGYTPDEMLQIVHKNPLFPRSSLRLRLSGFVDTGFLRKLFLQYMPVNRFEKLKFPLYVAVTNIVSGKTEYLSSGSLDEALLASSSIPMVFPPVKKDAKIYYDGGILNNLPVEPIAGKCEVLIGAHVNSLAAINPDKELAMGKTMDHVMHLLLNQSVYRNAGKCQLFLDPPDMTQFSLFDKKDVQKIYDHVYDYASRRLDTWKR